MITFHDVTKILGRRTRERIALDGVDFFVPAKDKLVVLGVRGAGKTTFLDILSGIQLPTYGWVERRGVVSLPGWSWLLRHGSILTTPRQLARRLATAFHASPRQVAEFTEEFSGLAEGMDLPTPYLAAEARQRLGLALYYALPCDLYLYDGTFESPHPAMKARCEEAYLQRREEAGMILATHLPKVARKFGGRGAVLHQGKLKVFRTIDEAIEVHEKLEIDQPADRKFSSEYAVAAEREKDDTSELMGF